MYTSVVYTSVPYALGAQWAVFCSMNRIEICLIVLCGIAISTCRYHLDLLVPFWITSVEWISKEDHLTSLWHRAHYDRLLVMSLMHSTQLMWSNVPP